MEVREKEPIKEEGKRTGAPALKLTDVFLKTFTQKVEDNKCERV